ncbi:hypothetical protein [Paenibacillus sedimenti]|uniref:Uncharacterized protein n=1 Tax=Paenibacillus sedimenti TaxID=2770274 RepID=A0A926KKX1_9BACL|nr:hypothetical protein [Paenibacillus sedimenti]MBD0379545.1 hypothetical protein [Paenibacillus sedimenti]
MNKKLAMLGLGVAVGSMMLVTSVYAGVGDAPGYETFKSAFKQTAAVDNATRQVNVSLQDNGTSLLNVKTTIKSNSDRAGSAEVTVKSGTEEQTIHFYSQDGKHIVKTDDSDVYKVWDEAQMSGKFKELEGKEHTPDPAMVQEVENVVDALVGNLKNYVTMDQAAGNVKEIHFKMSGSQISPVVNTIGSLVIKHHGTSENNQHPLPAKADTLGFDASLLKNSFPQLTTDIKMDEVEVNATVDADNHITNQTAQIHISGKDAGGAAHDVVLNVDMTLSSLNSTTPDTVDLTGKQVETVKFDEQSRKHWGAER